VAILPLISYDRARLATRLSQIGLVYFSFSAFYGPAQANQGFIIMLAALVIGRTIDGRRLIKDPLCITSLLFIAYVIIRGAAAALNIPVERDHILEYTVDWAKLGLLPALFAAAAIRISRFQPFHIIGLAIAGFFLKITLRIDWTNPYAYFEKFFTQEHARATFGYSVINLPLWALFFIIGLIIYSDDYVVDDSKVLMFIRTALFLATINLLFFIIIISKTRSIWILSCIFIPTSILLKIFQFNKIPKKIISLLILTILLVPGYFIYTRYEFFKVRLTAEREVIRQLLAADVQNVPRSSISERYYMYKVFFELAPERPLLGWGPGQTKRLLERSGYPGLDTAPHFHNIFVEIILQLGLVGLGIFTAMIAILFKACLSLQHAVYDQSKFKWFLLCSAAIFCATGLINHTLWSTATPYFFTMMVGIAYAPRADRYIRGRLSPGEPVSAP